MGHDWTVLDQILGGPVPVETDSALTVRQVAELLSVAEKTVYRLAQRGELPGFKVAGAWRFQRVDIDHWIDGQKRAARGSSSDRPQASRRNI